MQSLAIAPIVPPLTTRLRRAVSALVTLSKDRGRLDQVLVFALAVNAPVLAKHAARVALDDDGARLMKERPRIDGKHVDFAALERLPDGTLGREYARFLKDNGISPEPFEELPDVGDERAAYIIQRLRQTHDLWHVLTGYTPDVAGEVLLQAFTFAQLGLPSAFFLATFGTLRFLLFRRGHFRQLARAYRRGKATRFLPTVRWEHHWATPVAELRDAFHCPA